jgi:formylglycine-generating enzyme required for sulfatase activity
MIRYVFERSLCYSLIAAVCILEVASAVAGDERVSFSVTNQIAPPPQPGQKMSVDIKGMKMAFAWIPPGEFMMGSPATEQGREEDETRHKVKISKGFWMGVYEVTQEQWEGVVGKNPSDFVGKNRPVDHVNCDDAREFISRLNLSSARQEGTMFRLPTEAEWEYACRAGTTARYYFGEADDELHNYGNYCDISCTVTMGQRDTRYDDGHSDTAPVGSYKPNKYGLYDMHGNVWEWCEDWYAPYAAGPVTDPVQREPVDGTRVFRGGGWSNASWMCRSARRGHINPDMRGPDTGLRLVIALQ